MIVAGIIVAVVFVIALSRSAGLADRKMEEIYIGGLLWSIILITAVQRISSKKSMQSMTFWC